MKSDPRIELRELMNKNFSLGELKTLTYDLRIDFEDLEGESKSGKILSLILYAERRGRLKDLENYIRRSRPDIASLASSKSHKELESIDTNLGNIGAISVQMNQGALINSYVVSNNKFINESSYKKKLAQLQTVIKKICQKEPLVKNEYLFITDNLHDIEKEIASDFPRPRLILFRLEDTKKLIEKLRNNNSFNLRDEDLQKTINLANELIDETKKNIEGL